MKILVALALVLAISCAPATPSDPNAKNAQLAQAYCAQDEPSGWAALGDDFRAQFAAGAAMRGIDAEALFAQAFALPEGTTCSQARFVGSYADKDGNPVSVYVLTLTKDGKPYGEFYVFTSDQTGVLTVQ